MKFVTEKEKEEPMLILSLEQITKGCVHLIVTDKKGQSKTLMEFKNGKFYRCSFAKMEGLETDKDERILELF